MKFRFRILCFPAVQQLDLTGPYEDFASADGAEVHLVWKDLEPVRSSTGLWLKPDTRFADASDFDVLCEPGGAGVNALLSDEETLALRTGQSGSGSLRDVGLHGIARSRPSRSPQGAPRYHPLKRARLLNGWSGTDP